MAELRQNIITGEWVVVAAERAMRPEYFSREPKPLDELAVPKCPFCPGHENQTPPEVYALRPGGGRPDGPGWQVRVVPNKFPAFSPVASLAPAESTFYRAMPAIGRHEVIIHSPDHTKSPALMSAEEIARVLMVYQSRLRDLAREPGLKSAVVIVNHGRDAGASIEHPHSQLFALPLVAPLIGRELDRFADHQQATGRCVMCDLLRHEKEDGERVVAENDDFIAFCPYASRAPFEINIAPQAHQGDFSLAEPNLVKSAAELMKTVLGRLRGLLGDPPYNMYLHTLPFGSSGKYHWHFAVLPKVSTLAGFEFSSGIIINITEPEAAAGFLR